MKKIGGILLLALLLTGCRAHETFETVADVWIEPTLPQPGVIAVDLPGEAALPAMENDSGRIYLCSDYEVVLQTLPGGDVSSTIEVLCGFDMEDVTILSTQQDGMTRYEFVWAAVGEGGDQLGRAVLLDDGNYHYTMTVLRRAETVETSQVVWDGVFQSFKVNY